MKTSVVRSQCPGCKKELDRASSVGGDYKPQPGDFTVCISCGLICSFGEDMSLRRLTLDQMAWLDRHPETHNVLKIVEKAVKGQR